MLKNKINILICSNIVLSIYLSAAPLDKYYIPKQSSGYTIEKTEPDIEKEFRNSVSSLSSEEREQLKKSLKLKMKNAVTNRNFKAAAYYQQLLNILNTF